MSMKKSDRFNGVEDPAVLGRLLRSLQIMTINRFEHVDAVNTKNGHRYKVEVRGQEISCSCPDSQKGNNCKHEIAVARDLILFENYGGNI